MHVIRRAAASDLDAAASLLGLAYADDPWTRWCVDDDDHIARVTELHRLSLEHSGLPAGLAWVAEVEDQIASIGVWSDSRVPAERSVLIGLAAKSSPLHGTRLGAAVAAETGGFPRPTTPHLFLTTVGTHPGHQRSGLGTAVLRPALERADEIGLVCGLETSTEANVAFYLTLAFEVVHHRLIASDGPDVWTMWRASAHG